MKTTNGHAPVEVPPTWVSQCLDLLKALIPPKVIDMRKRCFEAAKAAGCTQAQLDAILAVPIESERPGT